MAPRKAWPQVPPEKLMQLRGNRSEAPGSPDKPRPKRTSAQVVREKADKEEAKRTKAAAQHANRQAVLEKEKEMRKQVEESRHVADHPRQSATKKASRPSAPDGGATVNRKEVKGPGQVPKDAVSQRSNRRGMADVPETEGEPFVFRSSNRSLNVPFQWRKQSPAPLEQGRALCPETMAKKLFLKQDLKVSLE